MHTRFLPALAIALTRTAIHPPQDTLPTGEKSNSVIAFHDNSSAIRGIAVPMLMPKTPGEPSPMHNTLPVMHPILTAETHNFPSGVAPFPGAE